MLKKISQLISNEPCYLFQQIIPKILQKINFVFSNYTNGYSLPPSRLLIALSTKCDLRCKMCCLWGKEGLGKDKSKFNFFQEKITISDIKKIIDSIAKYKPNIILTGGEPLLSNIWYDVVSYIKKKKLRIFLATGGSYLEKEKDKLLNTVDHLQISLDGPNKEIHDKSRGVDGSFDKVISGIKKIDELKKIKNKKKPFINICYTISDINYFSLVDTISFLDSLDIKINEIAFQHLEWTDDDVLKKHNEFFNKEFNIDTNFWSGFKYKAEDLKIDILIDQMKDVLKIKTKNINSIVFRPDIEINDIEKFYFDSDFVPDKFKRKCLASWSEIFLLPDGSIWTCADYITGNILEDDFTKIWNNEKSRKLRMTLNKIKYFPICKTCASLYVY